MNIFDINNNVLIIGVVLLAILLLILIFAILTFVNVGKKNEDYKFMSEMINGLEKNIIKDSHENIVNVINQNQNNANQISKFMQESFDKLSATNEKKLNEIRTSNEDKLNGIERNINEKLDKSLNDRLDSSFKTIAEQLQNLQVTNGKLLSMSSTIDDLQKSLSNVKARGVFGEKQLESILESLMPSGMYETQFKIKDSEDRKVDFAIKIPNKDDDGFVYLPIDAKFPNDRYLKVIEASNNRDEVELDKAIKELRIAVLNQARSISEKYVEPPITTEFAIMFMPTEGLYAECLRIDGLADECQKEYQVLLAGPTTITALINSFSIGFKFLQINKNSKEIARILQAIKTQYNKFGEEIDKTKKSIEKASESADQLAKRNKMITSKLKSFESITENEASEILGIDSNDMMDE